MWMKLSKLLYPSRLMGYLLALSFHRDFISSFGLRMKLSQDKLLHVSEILYCALEKKMILYLLWVNSNG